jgi:CubicO group peptidase (beta-lactamase class C family)
MWKRSLGVLAAGLLGIAISVPAFTQAPAPLTPVPQTNAPSAPATRPAVAANLTKADADAWLDGFLPYALARGDVAGAVVVIVKDGQVVTQRGFGYADVAKRKPVDPATTLFRPGSTSKLYTWTAVMQLVEAGKLNLDADVNQYLDFKIPLKDGKPVTMREIMQHTSGFEEHGKEIMFFDPKNLTSLGDYLKHGLPKRIYTPGTTPSYSNYATALAGYIVARVSGQSFDDYIDQHIFKPLGMAHSSFRQPLPAQLVPLMATGYPQASADPVKYEIVGPAPAGSLASPGTDMARFMVAHLNQGAGLMKPETARIMHESALNVVPPLNRMELGFFETNINGRQVIAHLGDTTVFHTSLHLFMKENVGFYVSFNSAGKNGAVGGLRGAMFQDFADRYLPSIAPVDGKVDAKTAAEHAKLMVGNWLNSRRQETSFMAITNLIGQATISLDDKGNLVVPMVHGLNGVPSKWVEIAPFVWRQVGGHERLAAQVIDGKVARWSFGEVSPFMIWYRTPASLDSAWLIPALLFGVAMVFLTALSWPVGWFARRRYGATLKLEGESRRTYRGAARLRLAGAGGAGAVGRRDHGSRGFREPWFDRLADPARPVPRHARILRDVRPVGLECLAGVEHQAQLVRPGVERAAGPRGVLHPLGGAGLQPGLVRDRVLRAW